MTKVYCDKCGVELVKNGYDVKWAVELRPDVSVRLQTTLQPGAYGADLCPRCIAEALMVVVDKLDPIERVKLDQRKKSYATKA